MSRPRELRTLTSTDKNSKSTCACAARHSQRHYRELLNTFKRLTLSNGAKHFKHLRWLRSTSPFEVKTVRIVQKHLAKHYPNKLAMSPDSVVDPIPTQNEWSQLLVKNDSKLIISF